MLGALVADEMGVGKTFTSVAAAMRCKSLTGNVFVKWPLSMLWGWKSGSIWHRTTIPELLVKNNSGI